MAEPRVEAAFEANHRVWLRPMWRALMRGLERMVAATSFRQVAIVHAERFPGRGPVLLVANHPATWTDVVVLDLVLPRRLRYLARSRLYRSRFRAWVMSIHGALPVARRVDDLSADQHNQATFDACRDEFRRGGVIVIFPEGVSSPGRAVGPLHSGAARLAIACADLGVVISPVALHYRDRTAPRSEVVVVVADPIPVPSHGPSPGVAPVPAVEALTARLAHVLHELLPAATDPDAVRLTDLGAALAPADLAAATREVAALAPWWRALVRERPAEALVIERTRRRWRRGLSALRLDPAAAHGRGARATDALTCLIGFPLAWAARIATAIPGGLQRYAQRNYAREPSRVLFTRITAGIASYPLVWLGAAALLLLLGLAGGTVALVLAAAAALAWFEHPLRERSAAAWSRLRVAWLARRGSRLLAWTREEHARLAASLRATGAPGPGR